MNPLPRMIGALVAAALTTLFIAFSVQAQTVSVSSAPAPSAALARVARGLIVELKPAGSANPNLHTPQAVRDQLASVARTAGLPAPDPAPRQVGAQGYLLNFAVPLQGAAIDAAVQSVAVNPAVQSVSADVRMHRMDTTPNDPYFANGEQWYLRTPDDPLGGASAIDTPPAWDVTIGQAGQVVAVVDSGALFDHPDLVTQFIPGYDFISDIATGNNGHGRGPDASDPGDWVSEADLQNPDFAGCEVEPSSWHGTFIAGIIGAATNNDIGVAGIDWNTKILPVRVSGKCGAWLSDILDGLNWASGGTVSGVPANSAPARVINISLGGDEACEPAYQSAINTALARGSLVVVAAGNSNTALGSPASCSGVLAVGAVRQDGLKTLYSSFGTGMGLMAPGGADESTLPNDWITSTSNIGAEGLEQNTYLQDAGTSFAAPMVTGVAALMLAVDPSLTPAQLTAMLKQSARPFPSNPSYPICGGSSSVACNCTTQTCGAGLLDAAAAVQLAVNNVVNGNSGTASSSGSDTSSRAGSGTTIPGTNIGSSGGGGATGWLWGLGLWGLAALALWQRRRKAG